MRLVGGHLPLQEVKLRAVRRLFVGNAFETATKVPGRYRGALHCVVDSRTNDASFAETGPRQ